MSKSIVHEPEAHRYAMYLDGALVSVADYADNGSVRSFHSTFTNPRHRGEGLAREVVDFAMDDVEQHTDRRVLPMCWYVSDWFEAHPERAALLSR